MTTPDPSAAPDVPNLVDRAWKARHRRPFDAADDECAWFVSRTARDALMAWPFYAMGGANPVSINGREVLLFNIRVVSGENLGDHVLLLAMEA